MCLIPRANALPQLTPPSSAALFSLSQALKTHRSSRGFECSYVGDVYALYDEEESGK